MSTMNSENDYHFTLLLLGDNAVGKTCFLQRFVKGTYTESTSATIGVDFQRKTIKLNGKSIVLKIFDTGGHKSFHSTTIPFYRQAHGFIVIYNVTNRRTFESLEWRLEGIDKYASKNVSKLIVGHMCDLINEKQVDYRKAKEFANSRGIPFLEASAKDNTNVEQAFITIASDIKKRMESSTSQNVNLQSTAVKSSTGRCY